MRNEGRFNKRMSGLQGTPARPPVGDSFAAMFEESLKHGDVKEGEIVRGRVIQINKDHVIVDIGDKSEGQVALAEFLGPDGQVLLKEGDEIDVYLESRENENGLCVLSKEKADRLKVWGRRARKRRRSRPRP